MGDKHGIQGFTPLGVHSLSLERETSTGVLANLSREFANLKRELAELTIGDEIITYYILKKIECCKN